MTASEADIQEDVDQLVEDAVSRGIPTQNYDAAAENPGHVADELAEALAQDYQAAGFEVDFDDGECITVYEAKVPSVASARAQPERIPGPETDARADSTPQAPAHEGTKRPLRITVKANRNEALAEFIEHDPGTSQCRMSLYRSRKQQTWYVGLNEAVDRALSDYGPEMDRVFYPTQSGVLLNLSATAAIGPRSRMEHLFQTPPEPAGSAFPVAAALGLPGEPDEMRHGYGWWILQDDHLLIIAPHSGQTA